VIQLKDSTDWTCESASIGSTSWAAAPSTTTRPGGGEGASSILGGFMFVVGRLAPATFLGE
jgi:hypothetical protein